MRSPNVVSVDVQRLTSEESDYPLDLQLSGERVHLSIELTEESAEEIINELQDALDRGVLLADGGRDTPLPGQVRCINGHICAGGQHFCATCGDQLVDDDELPETGAHPPIRTDGGPLVDFEDVVEEVPEPIEPGDVVLDLAQGRPMLVVDEAAASVSEWQETNDYDLLGNYANDRLDSTESDSVWTCVYVGSIRSEPSKSYDFPESRLARIEHEAAHGERVQRVIRMALLADLLEAAHDWAEIDMVQEVDLLAQDAGVPKDLVRDANELAEARLLESQ